MVQGQKMNPTSFEQSFSKLLENLILDIGSTIIIPKLWLLKVERWTHD